MTNTTKLISELRKYTGDLQRYRHGFNRRVIYTPGIQFLAEEAEAYCRRAPQTRPLMGASNEAILFEGWEGAVSPV